MSQSIGQREAFRRGRESSAVSRSPNFAPSCDNATVGKTPHIVSEDSSAIRSIGFPELDQHGRDAEAMRAIRGIGTAFIVGVCVFTILCVVGYFLWVYRP